jgi:hypothetical protein
VVQRVLSLTLGRGVAMFLDAVQKKSRPAIEGHQANSTKRGGLI